MHKKRKTSGRAKTALLALLAVTLAAAILAAGTLTYQYFVQSARNVFQGDSAPHGTRLHDDYATEQRQAENDKDVYVENFGEIPLMVRVRFREYYEVDADTGLAVLVGGEDGVVKGNPSTWPVSVYGVPNYASSDWEWVMEGEKWFLPTEGIADMPDGPFNPDNTDENSAYFVDNMLRRCYYDECSDLDVYKHASTVCSTAYPITDNHQFGPGDIGNVFTDNVFPDDQATRRNTPRKP